VKGERCGPKTRRLVPPKKQNSAEHFILRLPYLYVFTAEHLTHPGKTFGSRLNYTSMLNFFKLPFRGRSRAVSDQRNLPFLTVGLLKIYLRSENVSGDISEKAETTMRELEAMQREVSHSTPQDSYEIMVAALRRIEDSLD
jgi:hypothetical protein